MNASGWAFLLADTSLKQIFGPADRIRLIVAAFCDSSQSTEARAAFPPGP
jgi:hypothetical protein